MNHDPAVELPIDEYRRHGKNNEIEILQSEKCGCLFCRSVFSARRIKVAPLVTLIGFITIIAAIAYKPKTDKEENSKE